MNPGPSHFKAPAAFSLPGTPRPTPAALAPCGSSWRPVPRDLVFASFPGSKGGWHSDLLYLLLVLVPPILVFLGLKIHLPWR